MKKGMLFSGVVVLIFSALMIYISGIMTGGGSGNSAPVYPSLYSLQIVWTLMAVAGISLIISGFVFGRKRNKK